MTDDCKDCKRFPESSDKIQNKIDISNIYSNEIIFVKFQNNRYLYYSKLYQKFILEINRLLLSVVEKK